MQLDSTHSGHEAHSDIEFISINKNKVIYQDASGFVEKCFDNAAEARHFVADLTSDSN